VVFTWLLAVERLVGDEARDRALAEVRDARVNMQGLLGLARAPVVLGPSKDLAGGSGCV